MTKTEISFDDLEDLEVLNGGTSKPKVTFPCAPCGGTGKYRGMRLHQPDDRCFACGGRGYFLTSPEARERSRRSRAAAKGRAIAESKERLGEERYKFLLRAADWSEFANSLVERVNGGRALSDSQYAAIDSMMAKCAAKRKTREDARKAEAEAAPRFANLAEHFLTAAESLKWPKMRLATEAGDKIVLSRAGERSRNPGHINVTDGGPYGDNRYYGRIDPEGRAYLRANIPAEIEAELVAINDDPDAAIKVTGLRTGQCCLCGRELTNPDSIANGIGPICADKWGF